MDPIMMLGGYLVALMAVIMLAVDRMNRKKLRRMSGGK